MTYRHDIDGLRAIAVLAVIANHLFEEVFQNGYLGVDVFFVISGFVITASLAGREEARLSQFLIAFYARRMKRLLPALIVCCVVSAFGIMLFDPSPRDYLRIGFAAILGLSNILLYQEAQDYFSASVEINPFTHTWSLGVEEQFYFLFPFLFWFLHARRGDLEPTKKAIIAISLLVALSFMCWIWARSHDPLAAFYIVFFRGWQLLLGALVFLGTQALKARLSPTEPTAMAGSWALSAALFMLLLWPVSIQSALAQTLATLGTVALILWGCYPPREKRPGNALLLSTPMQLAGKMSYSLYLWHWPIIVFAKWTVGLSGVLTLTGVTTLILATAWTSYRFIETPVRYARWAQPRLRTIGYGVSAMLLSGAVVFVIERAWGEHFFLGDYPEMEAVGVSSLTEPYRTAGGSMWQGAACVLSDNREVGKIIPIEGCTLGDFDTAQRRILVIGNSFSAAFVASFDGPETSVGAAAVTITASWGASPAPAMTNTGPWREANAYYWSNVIPNLVARLSKGDTVLIMSDLSDLAPARPSAMSAAMLESFREGLTALSEELAAQSVTLAVLGPLPFARDADCEPVVAIPQWYAKSSGPCRFYSREETLARSAPLRSVLEALDAAQVAHQIDLFDLFCPGQQCTYISATDEVLYRDIYSHPSVEAARLAQKTIFERLSQIDDALHHRLP